jgi:chromatin segregation and condensation protein Rec8/ScpA/Scc1 (kleisin family)
MNDPVLAKTVEAVNKAEMEENKRPVLPQVNLRELEEQLSITDRQLSLGELLAEFTAMQNRHRKEIDEQLTRIVTKINSIKSNII